MSMDLALLYILSYIRHIPRIRVEVPELDVSHSSFQSCTYLLLHAMSSTAHTLLPDPNDQIMIFRVRSLLIEDLYRLS